MNKKKLINYIPFIGWLYTILLFHEDKMMKSHIKNALLFFILFASFPIFLTFLTILIPNNLRILRFIISVLINFSHFIYFILSIIGTIRIMQNKNFNLPFPKKLLKIIEF